VAIIVAVNVTLNSQSDNLSALSLANVEVLAQESGSDCDNINGYRQFSNIGSSYGAYDCCYIWRNGQGNTNCKEEN
jgi:hypothetical protein